MLVRQCTGWFVLHMFPHWLFITAAHYEKKGFIHHPAVMSFYMQTQFGGPASQMGCLWKRQRLSSNHSLLCDCAAGLGRKRGWCREEEGWAVFGVVQALLPRATSSLPHPTGQEADQWRRFITQWQGLMCFRYNPDRNPGVSYACTLMSCASSCCRGDYHLFWTLIPAGSKQERNRKVANDGQQGTQGWHHTGKFKVCGVVLPTWICSHAR